MIVSGDFIYIFIWGWGVSGKKGVLGELYLTSPTENQAPKDRQITIKQYNVILLRHISSPFLFHLLLGENPSLIG